MRWHRCFNSCLSIPERLDQRLVWSSLTLKSWGGPPEAVSSFCPPGTSSTSLRLAGRDRYHVQKVKNKFPMNRKISAEATTEKPSHSSRAPPTSAPIRYNCRDIILAKHIHIFYPRWHWEIFVHFVKLSMSLVTSPYVFVDLRRWRRPWTSKHL